MGDSWRGTKKIAKRKKGKNEIVGLILDPLIEKKSENLMILVKGDYKNKKQCHLVHDQDTGLLALIRTPRIHFSPMKYSRQRKC